MKKVFLSFLSFAFFFPSLVFSENTLNRYETAENIDLQREIEWLQAESFVFSASRREQKQSEVPASIFVITSEDIRRSTANSLPELLRMVPGIQVSRINGNNWAITARGFAGRYAGKLLVLMDGRTLYTPLFSGTYWDVQDTVLSDIERIEVIKGPGASLWGANAVNGIINIITKSAEDTQGGKVTAWAGKEEKGGASLRYGAEIAEKTYLRIYGKNYLRGNEALTNGTNSYDGIDMKHVGFRLDSEFDEKNEVTFQGDMYEGRENELKADAVTQVLTDLSGGNLLGKWKHIFSGNSETTLQVYFDRTFRKTSVLMDARDTIDVDFQHLYTPVIGHQIVWGLGYRALRDLIADYSVLHFIPNKTSENLFTGFVQDEISLSDDVKLTLGTKIEHNDHTGYEIQPTAKVMWSIQEDLSLWTSVSRAVSTPNRSQREMDVIIEIFPGFNLTVAEGVRDLKSEVTLAYEMGVRKAFADSTTLDISTFFNDHNKLISNGNAVYGYSRGVEAALTTLLSDRIKLKGGYSFFEGKLTDKETKATVNFFDSTPRHQFQLTSQVDLPYDLEFDTQLFYNSGFASDTTIYPEYYSLNVRLGWKPIDSLELSLVGQNLLLETHHEFEDVASIASTNIRRTFFAKIAWDF